MGKPTGIKSGLAISDKAEYQRQYYEKNKEERAAYARKWRKENAEAFKEAQRRWHASPHGREKRKEQMARRAAKRKAFLDSHKNVPCMDCGNKYPPYVMDFDHRDPSEKKFGIAQNRASVSIKALEREIAKCDVVCSNCHRERTHGESP